MIAVVGSINLDIVVEVERHPAPGETVLGGDRLELPGGKGANQAVAAAKLGATTALIGRVGKDAFGAELRSFLAGQGVDLSWVRETDGVHTGTAIITLANADNAIVVVPGANGLVTPDDVAAVPLAKGDVAVSQFEIPLPAISAFFAQARTAGAATILNPAPALEFGRDLLDLVDVLVLNETELGLLAKAELGEGDDTGRFIEAVRALRMRETQIICLTLGKRGVVALVDGEALTIPGRSVTAVDTTGAGDCFVGALAARLAQGSAIRDALAYANAAAAISVRRMGAAPSMPTAAEVAAAL